MYKSRITTDHDDGVVWIMEEIMYQEKEKREIEVAWYEVTRCPPGYDGLYTDGIMDGRVYLKCNTSDPRIYGLGLNSILL